MGKYVITERGKIAIAIIVMFFLIMPSLILVFWLMTRNSNSNETFTDRSGSIQSNADPADSEQASDAASGSSQESSNGNNNGPESYDPSLTGVKSFDFDAGIMSFLFTPDQQVAIDDNTSSMIGELLTSPKNTDDAKIAVEIPQLSDEETTVLTNAVINVLSSHDVSVNDIIFFVYQPEEDIRTFVINISFH